MYFVMSPTKNMKESILNINKSLPIFIDLSKVLMYQLQELSMDQIQSSMKVSKSIACMNYERYHSFCFDDQGQVCIDTYSGLVFKQLEIESYHSEQLYFMNQHIRILSGLYGVLKPFDSIYPYRLEMNYKPFHLVSYWQEHINQYFKDEIVVDVSSNEYGCLLAGEQVYRVQFKIKKNGVYVIQSTQAKLARGKFINYVILNQVNDFDGIKIFCEDSYYYSEVLSSSHLFVFVKD